jgi:hypothetical protein
MAGVAVMRRRPASKIGRQLTAFVLQALLLGGEMKIHASSPPQPPGRFCPVGSHTIASIKGCRLTAASKMGLAGVSLRMHLQRGHGLHEPRRRKFISPHIHRK